jgi:hypothetical protein
MKHPLAPMSLAAAVITVASLPTPAVALQAKPSARCPTPSDYPAGWDRLAMQESSGRWHIQGRLFSGGLQFTTQTWRAYRHCAGASQFAEAAQAPKATQIAVARFVLTAQGVCAWPLSSVILIGANCRVRTRGTRHARLTNFTRY